MKKASLEQLDHGARDHPRNKKGRDTRLCARISAFFRCGSLFSSHANHHDRILLTSITVCLLCSRPKVGSASQNHTWCRSSAVEGCLGTKAPLDKTDSVWVYRALLCLLQTPFVSLSPCFFSPVDLHLRLVARKTALDTHPFQRHVNHRCS